MHANCNSILRAPKALLCSFSKFLMDVYADGMAVTPASAKNRRNADTGCCSLVFLRSVLVVFIVIFWLTGGTFLAVGLWTFLSRHDYIGLLDNNTYSATTFLFLSIGIVIILVGCLGCVGALQKIRCCLITFAFVLLIIFVMEAISGVLAYMYESAIQEELSRNLNNTLTQKYNFDLSITTAVDSMQKDFQCCGASSYKDWDASIWLQTNTTDNKVPDSCCISPSDGCGQSEHPSNIYTYGCSKQLIRFIKSHLIIIGGIGLGFSCLQIFGIIFSCCLAWKIKEMKGFL